MKETLKRIAQKLLSGPLYAALSAISARRWIEHVEREKGLDALTKRYVATHGRTVAAGPFQGMVYSPLADHRHVGARLLGCYERELAPAVERFCQVAYEQVLDVGCAEGYYAVGFARRIPSARVIAFDTDPWARRACRDLAGINGVRVRVEVHGFCSPDRLQHALSGGRALLILDCEGYEEKLLDPAIVAQLARCDLIVELHDAPPTPDHPLAQRFSATHAIELIPSVPRVIEDAGAVAGFTAAEQLQLMDEMRQPWQGWAIFRAK